jgi:hypothetical protein
LVEINDPTPQLGGNITFYEEGENGEKNCEEVTMHGYDFTSAD